LLKFGILWLFSLTSIIGILFAVAAYSLEWSFFLACVLLGSYVGIAARSQFQASHTNAVLVIITTSTVVGAIFLSVKSNLYPFVEPSVSFLVADGWHSAGSAFIVGSIAGAISSLFAVPIYALFACVFKIRHD